MIPQPIPDGFHYSLVERIPKGPGPLTMGAISDAMGRPKYGFILATGVSGLLFVGLLLNWLFDPARELLSRLEDTEYR